MKTAEEHLTELNKKGFELDDISQWADEEVYKFAESYAKEVAEETVDKCLEAIPDQPPETHIHYVDEIIEDIRNRIGNVKNEL